MICSRPRCERRRFSGELCAPHWKLAKDAGEVGKTSAEPAKAHIDSLIEQGWLRQEISEAAGLPMAIVWKVHAGQRTRIHHKSAKAILSVSGPPPASKYVGVNSVGARRRVQGLRWMGWPASEVAPRAGLTPASLYVVINRPTVGRSTHYAIAKVYEELAHLRGPSKLSATRARAKGYAPPLAWDDIDNPRCHPKGVR